MFGAGTRGTKEPAFLASSGGHDIHSASANNSQLSTAHVNEVEPPTSFGLNNTQSTAQFLPTFGTGTGDQAAIDIAGFLGPLPPSVTPVEDNGSITLANPTGLVAGGNGNFMANGTIGDGPHGSTGTQSGDYDHFKLSALANQLLTVDVKVSGSTLNSVVAIYNDSGALLVQNDDKFNNVFYGVSLDSHLRFLLCRDLRIPRQHHRQPVRLVFRHGSWFRRSLLGDHRSRGTTRTRK